MAGLEAATWPWNGLLNFLEPSRLERETSQIELLLEQGLPH